MTSPTIDKHAQRELIADHLRRQGWHSGGFDGEFYLFSRRAMFRWQEVKGEPGLSKLVPDENGTQWTGHYFNVLATEEDMKDGAKGLIWMLENGYTRVES